jgi:hypothetical protein
MSNLIQVKHSGPALTRSCEYRRRQLAAMQHVLYVEVAKVSQDIYIFLLTKHRISNSDKFGQLGYSKKRFI